MASSFDCKTASPLSSLRSPVAYPESSLPAVIVVDDENLIADTLAAILNCHHYNAIAAYGGEEALAIAREIVPHFLITDVMMTGMDGIDLALAMEELHPECTTLLLSGQVHLDELRDDPRWIRSEFPLFNKPLHPVILLEQLAALSMKPKGSTIPPKILSCGQVIEE
jgi:DNA-binding NtrC family response regulator